MSSARNRFYRTAGWDSREAMAERSFDVLVERTEHEVIIMTRRARPDLVLISYEDWQTLNAAAEKRSDIEREATKDVAT